MRLFLALWVAGLVLALSGELPAADKLDLPQKLTVAGGERVRTNALVEYPLPPGSAGSKLRLIETTGGREVPVACQVDAEPGRLRWVAAGKTAVGAKRTYRLEEGEPAAGPEISVVDSAAHVAAQLEGQPLLQYNKSHVDPPAGMNRRYGRSAHLHPVRTPGGAVVTDEFPPDHAHHCGIFLAYTKTKFEERDIDFWNLAGGKARVRARELKGTTSGPVFGEIRAVHEHVDLSAEENPDEAIKRGGKVALLETWNLRIWNAGQKEGYWLLDIDSSIRCAGESPLLLPEYHYGGMALRGARAWTPEVVTFLTSEGDDRLRGNHTRPRWCDITGIVGDKAAGLTIMTHPGNFRFPEPLRIHPTMPYLVYTPSFLGAWQITPEKSHVSRYRFVIHDGPLAAEAAEQLWQDFAHPLVAVAE